MSSKGQWSHFPQMVKIHTVGHCIHIHWWIFMGLGHKNIGVCAQNVTPNQRSSRGHLRSLTPNGQDDSDWCAQLVTVTYIDGFSWDLDTRILGYGHIWHQLRGHLGVIWDHWPQVSRWQWLMCTVGYCIHIFWWLLMGLGQKNIGEGALMWTQLLLGRNDRSWYHLYPPGLTRNRGIFLHIA